MATAKCSEGSRSQSLQKSSCVWLHVSSAVSTEILPDRAGSLTSSIVTITKKGQELPTRDSILLSPCSFPQEHAASQNPVQSRSILTWWITYMSSPQDWLELKELGGPARKPRSTFTVWHLHTLKVRSFCEVKYCCVKREMEFSQQNWKGAQPSVCWLLPVPEPCLGVEALWGIGLCMFRGAWSDCA